MRVPLALFILVAILVVIGAFAILSRGRDISMQNIPNKNSTQNSEIATALEPPANCKLPTPATTEGPYYKAGSSQRTSLLEEGLAGEKIIVTGFVMDNNCQPIQGAWLDFWQADGEGNYDNAGYRLRGHQFTNNEGKYYLETILPAEYPGRTPHIHVKVRAREGGSTLTSQLYFPLYSTTNSSDSIFTEETLVSMQDVNGQKVGYYNFYLAE